MTEGQKRVYDFIVEYMTENLYAPSIRDICIGTGYTSTSTINNHLYKLQRLGYIELGEYGSPRAIKLIGYKLVKENSMFKMYGFFDDAGILIDKIPSTGIDEAKEAFERENPEVKYLYVEVLY